MSLHYYLSHHSKQSTIKIGNIPVPMNIVESVCVLSYKTEVIE